MKQQRNLWIALGACAALALVLALRVFLGGAGPTDGDALAFGERAGDDALRADAAMQASSEPTPGSVAERARAWLAPSPAVASAPAPTAPSAVDPSETVVVGRVVDESGAALAGAAVELGGTLEREARLASARERGRLVWEARAVSQADGRFRVEGVPAHGVLLVGRVVVLAHAELELAGLLAAAGTTTDLGDLVVGDGALVHGSVHDDLGNAVPEADVLEASVAPGPWSSFLRASTSRVVATSDAAGRFEVGPLAPGEHTLAALARDLASDWSPPVRVGRAETPPEVELVLTRARALVGRVSDRSGAPLMAEVRALPQGGEALPLAGRAGVDGRFALAGGRPGQRYSVVLTCAGYRDYWLGRARLPAVGEPDEPLEVVLSPALTVHARVLDGASGAPIEGARLYWAGANAMSFGVGVQNGLAAPQSRAAGLTGPDGRATLAGVTRASFGLVARAASFAPAALEHGGARGGGEPELEVELVFRLDPGTALRVSVADAAGPLAGAALELRRVDAFGSERRDGGRGGDGGRGRNNDGGRRERDSFVGASDVTRPLLARATSDATGTALFENLQPDAYMVMAEADGHARVASDELVLELGTRGHELYLHLPAAATLAGRVVVRGRGEPDQLVVAVGDDGLERSTRSLAEGAYELGGLPPGAYRVHARRGGAAPSTFEALLRQALERERENAEKVVLAEGQRLALELEGEGGGLRLEGVVLINHEPRAGLEVRGSALSEEEAGDERSRWRRAFASPRATTDSEGRFVLEGLQPGRYSVSAARPGGRGPTSKLVQSEVVLEPERDAACELSGVTTSLSVELRMQDEEQALPRWVRLDLTADDARGGVPGFAPDERWTLGIGRSGVLEVEELPEGAYQIEAADRQFRAPKKPLELRGGRPEELELVLQPRTE